MTFEFVDDASIALEQPGVNTHGWPVARATSLGPIFEICHLTDSTELHWLNLGSYSLLLKAMHSKETFYREANFHEGTIPSAILNLAGTQQTDFSYRARRAANHAGFSKTVSNQLVAAIVELASNIDEHSEAPSTGYVAFSGGNRVFEFVVGDRGVGVLESLRRNSDHNSLLDAGTALELALTDGISRYSDVARGRGFRPLLVGLANESQTVRFRSGDHVRQMNRAPDGSIPVRTAQKAQFQGFSISVRCTVR